MNTKSSGSFVKQGGIHIRIGKPIYFRLRLDIDKTLGALLGYAVPSDDFTKPEFTKVVTNNNSDLRVPINLSGDTYIYMLSKILGYTIDTGGIIEDVFAKIQLGSSPGSIIFNSYIGGSRKYTSPIPILRLIDFQFVEPINGNLVEFNNQNHSLTLEITERLPVSNQ